MIRLPNSMNSPLSRNKKGERGDVGGREKEIGRSVDSFTTIVPYILPVVWDLSSSQRPPFRREKKNDHKRHTV